MSTLLRLGSHGPEVERVQRVLNARGASPRLVEDGVFGPRTAVALTSYQLAHGLTVDGIAGPATLAELGRVGPVARAPHAIPLPPPGWLVGIDISDAQGRVDGEALASAGVEFAWIKACEGMYDRDAHAAHNARSLASAGVEIGFYAALSPYGEDKADEQADNFARALDAIGLGVGSLWPALDFELAAGLTGLDALASALRWCEIVERRLGRGSIVYTGPAFFDLLARYAGAEGADEVQALATRPLWVAHYTQDHARLPRPPRAWSDWTIWQASGDRPRLGRPGSRNFATLPGRPLADVDINFFRGDREQLLLRARKSPAPEASHDG